MKDFEQMDAAELGRELHEFAASLYPICRSITGNGMRQTLAMIQERIPLRIREVPTGTQVFDWNVPKEWNIREAYIKAPDGTRVVDFKQCNLHVVSYSTPIHTTLKLEELRPHLFSIPEHPDWIPYRTSYYQHDWGFCLSHNQLLSLTDANYEVCIDSTLEDGSLTYGECLLPGSSPEEVLISCHACHPSLANDNLSGVVVATYLAKHLSERDLRYSYRFLFVPGTIGSITWLAQHQEDAERIRHGLVLTCIGDQGGFHYKKSRRGDAFIDRAVTCVLRDCNEPAEILDFSPYGYDERQYCSPGFNLPVGCLMRSVWGSFPEYHTSADNLDFIQPKSLATSIRACISIVRILENNRTYSTKNPYCEPQLGKRGLYQTVGGESPDEQIEARLWVLNFSDGEHSLLAIAERSGLPFTAIHSAARLLAESDLLVEVASADHAQ
jgi:aminopeptidase-like protein